MSVTISNDGDSDLWIMLEPAAISYRVKGGCEAVFTGDFRRGMETIRLDVGEDRFLSLWCLSDVVVEIDGVPARPSDPLDTDAPGGES